MDKYIGKKLDGRYEILEIIGIGGMANVYKALDAIEDRIVAVKILREEYVDNEEFLRRFKNESKAIAVLAHPNIVKVFDVSFNPQINFIVMEHIDGITLKEYIEQQRIIGWKESLHFTVQILHALQHAHDKGIVHRDIKPHNIMLLSSGAIKVTDFGIARFARSETKTLTDRAIGSVHYISPEQARGENTDEKADIYSVGIMLFEMLTGQLPFQADSPISVALKQIQTIAINPRSINPNIPMGLEEITIHAMQKNARNRYQSAAAMLRDLEEFRKNPNINFEYSPLEVPEEPNNKNPIDSIESEPMSKTMKRAPFIPVLTGVTFAFVIAAAIFIGMMVYLNNPFEPVEEIEMPNLVGVRYDSVVNSPQYKELFVIELKASEYNDQHAKGVIFETEPKYPKNIKKGSTVKVKVSNGPQMVIIPDWKGIDLSIVTKKVTDFGLTYSEHKEFHETIPEGSIIRTEPDINETVSSGTEVKLYISMGKKEKLTKVPRIEGLLLEDAEKLLSTHKLKMGTKKLIDNEEMPEGTIVSQDPGVDVTVPEGTAINVQVASETTDGKTLQMKIDLPESVDRIVTITSALDGEINNTERLNPARTQIWKPKFTGAGDMEIEIFIDDQIYQVYRISFDRNSHTLITDYSSSFTR